MSVRAALVLACIALWLGACAKPTPYAPAGSSPYGYSETKIDDDTIRIEVAGNSKTTRSLVENQLLYRAAQLAQQRGDAVFVFITRDTERDQQVWAQPGGLYPYGYGGFGFGWPGSYGGLGLGYALPIYRSTERYTVYAEARFYKEKAPEGMEPAYSAAEVLANLKGKINLQPESDG